MIINHRINFPLFQISEQENEIITSSINDGRKKIIPFMEEFMVERQEIQEKNEEKRELGEMNPILPDFSGLLMPFHEMAKFPKNQTVSSFEPKFEKNTQRLKKKDLMRIKMNEIIDKKINKIPLRKGVYWKMSLICN
jgi:hypothetical protein